MPRRKHLNHEPAPRRVPRAKTLGGPSLLVSARANLARAGNAASIASATASALECLDRARRVLVELCERAIRAEATGEPMSAVQLLSDIRTAQAAVWLAEGDVTDIARTAAGAAANDAAASAPHGNAAQQGRRRG